MTTEQFARVSLGSIVPSLTNPRKTFDPAKLQDLADSIRATGVHQPVLLRPLPGHRIPDTDRAVQYELVAGERRYRASQMAGAADIPAIIRTLDDAQTLEIQIVENLQRDDLTPLEEAEGYEYLCQHTGISKDDLAGKIGKSRSYVYQRLKLLDLCHEGREALRHGQMDASVAVLVARIPDHELQLRCIKQVSADDYHSAPSFRECKRIVQDVYMLNLSKATFDVTSVMLIPDAGACISTTGGHGCQYRTGANPDLFADVGSSDLCIKPSCYKAKDEAHRAAARAHAIASGCTVYTGKEAKAMQPSPWVAVEGHLRIDHDADTPIRGQTLRKLIGDLMVEQDIQPDYIEDQRVGHDDLVAILPTTIALRLLEESGHAAAKEKAQEIVVSYDDMAENRKQSQSARTFEDKWRRQTVNAIAQRVLSLGSSTTPAPADMAQARPTLNILASQQIQRTNGELCKRLCVTLGLGKVAPKEGLRDYVANHPDPVAVLQLLLAAYDSEYNAYDAKCSVLDAMASANGVDIAQIKADVLEADAPKKAEASQPKTTSHDDPAAPAAPTASGSGPANHSRTKRPAGQAEKPKTSPVAASAQIAAALQELEQSKPDGEALAASERFCSGQSVRVKISTQRKLVGKVGVIEGKVDSTIRLRYGPKIHETALCQLTDLEAYCPDINIGVTVRVLYAGLLPERSKLRWRTGVVEVCTDQGWRVNLTATKTSPAVTEIFDAQELEATS